MINDSCNHIGLAFHMCTYTLQVHMFIISNELLRNLKIMWLETNCREKLFKMLILGLLLIL